MSIQKDTDNGFLLTGTGYVRNRRVADGQKIEIGNLVSLKLKANSETKKRISKKKESAGSALDSVTIKDATEVSFSSDTFNKLTLAMALSGRSAELKAVTVTDEVVEVSKKGTWLQLANRNIDVSTVSVKNDSDQTVAKDDVVINETLGWILIKESCSNVNDNSAIEVSYQTKSGGGIRIEAGTESDYDFELWLDGFNRASQKNFMLHIPSMVVSPSGEIDWLGDDFASAEFTGTAVLVNGYQVPYIYEEFN